MADGGSGLHTTNDSRRRPKQCANSSRRDLGASGFRSGASFAPAFPENVVALLPNPELHVVAGKGGTGKSTVAAALAVALSKRRARVLAVELEAPAGLSRIFGARPPEPNRPIEVRQNLWLEVVSGRAALAEYLQIVLKLRPLVRAVIAHPLYRAFTRAAPGLKELMCLGKICTELPSWDAIVLDAGASAQALQCLKMPSAAERAFGAGRVHSEAAKIRRLLADETITKLHIVAIPEVMACEEAVAIAALAGGELHLPLAPVIVNRCLETPPLGAEAAIEQLETFGAPSAGVVLAARRALAWGSVQEQNIARLEAVLGPALRLPRIDQADPVEPIAARWEAAS